MNADLNQIGRLSNQIVATQSVGVSVATLRRDQRDAGGACALTQHRWHQDVGATEWGPYRHLRQPAPNCQPEASATPLQTMGATMGVCGLYAGSSIPAIFFGRSGYHQTTGTGGSLDPDLRPCATRRCRRFSAELDEFSNSLAARSSAPRD